LLARRSSVARSEGLRRLWLIGGLTLVVSVAVAAIAILNSSWFDVEQVRVLGAERSDPEQIVTASAVMIGEPLVEVDARAVESAVREVPWVAEASVSRSWGGDVTIEIVERIGVVALPTGSRYALVDDTGQQVEVIDQLPEHYLPVTGVQESGVPGQPVSTDGLLVVNLMEELSDDVAAVATGITIAGGELMIDLAVGGRANLGDDRALADKMVAIETVLARVDLTCLDVIDVRVPAAPTLKRVGAGDQVTAGNEEPDPGVCGC
jgi:cell division septal protein FtsQ